MKNPHLFSRRRCEGSRSNDNLLELKVKEQKSQVYNTQELSKFDKRKQNVLPNDMHETRNQQFFSLLKSNSFFYGV